VPQSGEVWATLLGTSQCLRSFPAVHSFSVASSILTPTYKVTTLQANIRCSCVCSLQFKNVHFHFRELRHIRSSVTDDMATSIALIHSCLYYANSLLYGISSTNIYKLQRFQNTAARLILQESCTASVQYLMDRLHCLPIRARIDFKIAALTYKTGQPTYLCELVSPYQPSSLLRSINQLLLALIPATGGGVCRVWVVSGWGLGLC